MILYLMIGKICLDGTEKTFLYPEPVENRIKALIRNYS